MARPRMRSRMRLRFKSRLACVTVRSMRNAFSGMLLTRRPRIATERRNGASILSMSTMRPSCRAFHQTHNRIPLETVNGVNQIANSAASRISRLARNNRVLNGIGWQKHECDLRIVINETGSALNTFHQSPITNHQSLFTFLLVLEDQMQWLRCVNALVELPLHCAFGFSSQTAFRRFFAGKLRQ